MKLYEIIATPNSTLSQEQKECLLRVYLASNAGPTGAMQSITGDVKLLAAAEYLIKVGALTGEGGIAITRQGINELVQAGILAGKMVTNLGKQLLGQSSATKP